MFIITVIPAIIFNSFILPFAVNRVPKIIVVEVDIKPSIKIPKNSDETKKAMINSYNSEIPAFISLKKDKSL